MGNTAPNVKNNIGTNASPLAKATSITSLTSFRNSLRRSLRRRVSAAGDLDRHNRHIASRRSRVTLPNEEVRYVEYGKDRNETPIRRDISTSDESTTSDGDCAKMIDGDMYDLFLARNNELLIGDINKYKIHKKSASIDKHQIDTNNHQDSVITPSTCNYQAGDLQKRKAMTLQANYRKTEDAWHSKQVSEKGGKNVTFSLNDVSADMCCKDIWLEGRICLDKVMSNKWISGIAVTKRGEYVIVDLKEAFLVDREGQVKRQIGGKGFDRLLGPIAVTVLPTGSIAFSDHATQDIKIFTAKGQFVTTVRNMNFSNIAGLSADAFGTLYVAGADKKQIFIIRCEDSQPISTVPPTKDVRVPFEHPYSLAYSTKTGDLIVGDDNKQMVIAIKPEDGRVLWRFCPPGHGQRHFFPSSIAVDEALGVAFVADLYNEKVYAIDVTSGAYLKTVLSRGDELRGGPSAIAVDGCGRLLVADEERTLKVFRYNADKFCHVTPSSSNGSLATQQSPGQATITTPQSVERSMTTIVKENVALTFNERGKCSRHPSMIKTSSG